MAIKSGGTTLWLTYEMFTGGKWKRHVIPFSPVVQFEMDDWGISSDAAATGFVAPTPKNEELGFRIVSVTAVKPNAQNKN